MSSARPVAAHLRRASTTRSADSRRGPGHDGEYGAHRVQALRALASRAPPNATAPARGPPDEASSLGGHDRAQPSRPRAPPWTRGSSANATAVIPSMSGGRDLAPLLSCGVSRRTEPGSNSA